jgi:predicted nucleic acid-binding protein
MKGGSDEGVRRRCVDWRRLGSPGASDHTITGASRRDCGGSDRPAPALWSLEASNALLVLTRRGKLTEDERAEALTALAQLSVVLDHEMAALAFGKLSDLATRHGLSVYDAAYLELAMRRKLPIACKDGPLRTAAKRARVKLL